MRTLLKLSSLLFLTAAGAVALADTAAPRAELTLLEESAERCISLNRIKNMESIDTSHILVYTRSRETFVNVLPQPCPSLNRHKPILYRTSQHQLCNVDIITVLESVGGGYMPGGSCGLGKFYAIDEAQEKLLKQKP